MGKTGSGKGTQAKIIADKLGILHISTGELCRQSTGEFGKLVHSYIDKGNFISDELMIKMLKERISKEDCKGGFILEGFPRTLSQAEELEKLFKADNIIEIYISDEEAIKRMNGRRTCRKCSAIYNIYTFPVPKKENICDHCGGKLYAREDQTEDAIKQRMLVYHRCTEPILEKYPPVRVDGSKSIEQVTKEILAVLK